MKNVKNFHPGEMEVTSAHEYRSLDHRKASDQVTVTIDRGGGGSKDDKFGRDISLLTKELEQEPDNQHYMFYLAEFYRHGKRYRSAIEWYRKGIDREGWQEETWYARYMIGACHEALGELPEATAAYLDAHIDRPTRAEPLHDLARLWRLNGNPRLGYFLNKRASEVPTYRALCQSQGAQVLDDCRLGDLTKLLIPMKCHVVAPFPPDPDEITRPNEPLTDPDKTWLTIDPSDLPTDPNLPSPWDPKEDEDPTQPIRLPTKEPSKNPGKKPCP